MPVTVCGTRLRKSEQNVAALISLMTANGTLIRHVFALPPHNAARGDAAAFIANAKMAKVGEFEKNMVAAILRLEVVL